MNDSKQHMNTLWYTRRGEAVKGPFPVGLIRRYVLLGRIHEDDEVSQDGQRWLVIKRVAELIPPELKNVGSVKELEQLKLVRRHADERGSHDRREGEERDDNERRMRIERRKAEARSEILHREMREKTFGHPTRSMLHYLPRLLGLVVILGLLFAVVSLLDREGSVQTANCDAPATAGVNWSHCRMEGLQAAEADLSGAQLQSTRLEGADLHGARLMGANMAYADLGYANLQGSNLGQAKLLGANLQNSILVAADLSGADLSYADMRFADLTNANLSGVRLDKTVWIDGRLCAPGSVGRCQ